MAAATAVPEEQLDSTINNNLTLTVPKDPLSNSGRPESPVNRKRADDDDFHSGQGHHHKGGSLNNNSLPPSKKSKTSPPLAPSKNVYLNSGNSSLQLSDYRTSKETVDETLSPQTSPMLEPLPPISTSMSEKRYSSAVDSPTQSKARKLDDHHQPLSPSFQPTSPSFRASSPPFKVSSPPFRPTSPSFGRSATAILESLSKPGENSLGNLNLGTPAIGRTPVGERVMGVITSQPNSRHTSPDPHPTTRTTGEAPGETVDADLNDIDFSLDDISHDVTDVAGGESSPAGAMRISDDDTRHNHDYDQDDDNAQQSSEGEPMHPIDGSLGYISESDEFGEDSMDEIDVEGIGMLDSDSDSEANPYQDPDPMCLDRLSEEEADIILEEARMHESVTENDLIRTISERLRKILRKRTRLQHIYALEHVVNLLKTSNRIMVLTGAGVSVSCGIPDFRSEDGIYSRLSEFELDDPQQMFDLEFFRERPQIFYSFAREIFPSNFVPSPSHYFIKLIEDQGKLLRNYTQNIDTLEQKAGIQKVLQCHGSFATASCVRCGHQVPGDDIKDQIFKQEVAYCKACKTPSPPPTAKKRSRARARYHSSDEDESDDDDDDRNKALMKPDIVFFGEKLPAVFHQSLKEDREKVDLLIVIGSSLKVAPVSDIMLPQILINRTPNYQMEFDVQLLGNCDTIVAELCRMAGWELRHEKLPGGTSNVPDMDRNTNRKGSGDGGRAAWSFMEPNIYLFEGADLEELNFQAIQARNRKRIRDEPGGGGATLNKQHKDFSGEESPDVEDMEGMTNETSGRTLFTRNDRSGSTGPMDEDEHEDDDGEDESDSGSEESQDTVKGTTSTSQDQVIVVHGPLASPSIQPVGFTSETTEPSSGSITEIHQTTPGTLGATKADVSTATSTSSSSGLVEPRTAAVQERNDDDDEEEAKIRVMFTEKMPKDLGEEQGDEDGPFGHGHSLGHSQGPSEDLKLITEDRQRETEDDDNNGQDAKVGAPVGTTTQQQTGLTTTEATDDRLEGL
ncbi:NAD-dependent histone deacetylase sir2 [Modicella reniformis]|uniref:NAD-dependent histone deacetylase sir2 n=1 Tax=Modicella reniformis TaxID=1440133 RepID=A0A9P6M8I1_9FUNG|nr:NAD-dependent histone deacetylase sir2 [Modicella reniformis]